MSDFYFWFMLLSSKSEKPLDLGVCKEEEGFMVTNAKQQSVPGVVVA